MHDLFISYSHVNKDVADAICHHLENEGIRCWYAPRDIKPGDNWASAIVQAIRKSRIFVLVYSKDSNNSDQVLREIALAAESDCLIIPFRIDESKMSDSMDYYLHAVHWFDALTPPLLSNIARLNEKIQAVLDRGRPHTPPSVGTIPVPPEKKTGIKPRMILPAILLAIVLFGIPFALIAFAGSSLFDEKDASSDVPNIDFTYMSKIGDFRYPFYNRQMISRDGNLYFLENTEDGRLYCATAEGGTLASETRGFVYPYTDSHRLANGSLNYPFITAITTQQSDYVCFIDMADNTVKILDSNTETWISKGLPLGLTDTEVVDCWVYPNGFSDDSSFGPDCLSILVYDRAPDAGYYTKILILQPSMPEVTVIDISEKQLTGIICTYTCDDDLPANCIVVRDAGSLFLLNITNGDTTSISNQQFYHDYFPRIGDTSPYTMFSTDGTYMACLQSDRLEFYITETGTNIWSYPITTPFHCGFLPDNTFFYFDNHSNSLMLYDPKEGKHTTLFQKDFFLANELFPYLPHKVQYSAEHELFFFISNGKNEAGMYSDFLVVTDLQGNVLAKSEFPDIPYDLYDSDVWVTDKKVYYLIRSRDPFLDHENGISTMIYCSMFAYNSEGNIEFYPNDIWTSP